MTDAADPVTTELEAMRNRPARDVWVMLEAARRDNGRLIRTLEAIRAEAARWKRDSANPYAARTESAEKLERILEEWLLGGD
jgi:hypothetical protein